MSGCIKSKHNADFGYLFYEPETKQGELSPLVIFLHGAGERGTDLNLCKLYGPFKKIENGWQPHFTVAAPQCPSGFHWTDMTIRLRALIADICLEHPVDRNRIYIMGVSMGGFGTWAMLAAYPQLFAAAVPMCGGGQPWTAGEFSSVPVWAFHGDKDDAVNIHYGKDMVDAVNRCGGNAMLTIYEGAGHNIWDVTCDRTDMWDWLLAQNSSSGSKCS